MKYQLVIFDFDGTLADSFPWAASVVNQYAERYRFKRIDPAEHAELRNYDARRLMRHLGVRMWRVPGMARDVRKRMAQEIDKIHLFPGTSNMLQALADAGVLLAVVSSNSEEMCALCSAQRMWRALPSLSVVRPCSGKRQS